MTDHFHAIGSVATPLEPPNRAWIPVAILLSLTLLALGVPHYLTRRAQGKLDQCRANVRGVSAALELYAGDNAGQYPKSLDQLTHPVPYLKQLPTCPATGSWTYTDYRASHTPEAFSFSCAGNNHARAYRGFATSSNNYPFSDTDRYESGHP